MLISASFVETCTTLLDAHADVNFVMPRGAYSAQLSVLGADAPSPNGFYAQKNTQRGNGATALHIAVENGHAALVALLLQRGAEQLPSMEGVAPLLLAVQYHHPHIALVLARHNPDRAVLDAVAPHDGASALFAAAGSGYAELVGALLTLGADPDVQVT